MSDPFDKDYWRQVERHGRTCDNCGRAIHPAPRSSTGWTHDDGDWQGVRCAGMVCGATPIVGTGDGDPVLAEMTGTQITLDLLKVTAQRVITEEAGHTLAGMSDWQVRRLFTTWAGDVALSLTARVLAESLPPQEITHQVAGWTPLHAEGTVPAARFATWWDHFKATHRGRWWMRWRHWPVHYTWEFHRWRYDEDRQPWRRTVTVSVRHHWTYPRAAIPLPPEFGGPVLATTWEVDDRDY